MPTIHQLPDGTILEVTDNEIALSEILTQKELADFFGVSERSIGVWRIPNVKIGERRFYFKDTVVAWMRRKEA